MNLLVLGRGKTGSLVAEVARSRRHHVRVLFAAENAGASALTPDSLAATDVVIDFTTPAAVGPHPETCIHAKQNPLFRTPGWPAPLPPPPGMGGLPHTTLLHQSNLSLPSTPL